MKLRFVSIALLAITSALAQAPDNTKINKRDDVKHPVTADQQSNAKADLDLVRQIRKEISQEKNFSTYAKNVKVITRDGMATLRGPVKSDEEKQAIEAIAKRIAGDGKVESHLEIAPPK
jgi:hyperosmotically inducible periplasmic protein